MPALSTCPVCAKQFSNHNSVRRHSRDVHQLQLQREKPRGTFSCSMCFQCFENNPSFEEHISVEHDFRTVSERLSFPSGSDFFEWKRTVEKGPTKFVVRTSRFGEDKRLVHYRCHRDGPSRIRVADEDRKRRLKSEGSQKINHHCPARIVATFFDEGKVDVYYCSSHFGHDLKLLSSPVVPSQRSRKKTGSKLIIKEETEYPEELTYNGSIEANETEVSDGFEQMYACVIDAQKNHVAQDFKQLCVVVVETDNTQTSPASSHNLEDESTLSFDLKNSISDEISALVDLCSSKDEALLVIDGIRELRHKVETLKAKSQLM